MQISASVRSGSMGAEPEFSTYEYECYRYAAGPVEEIGNIYQRVFPACSRARKRAARRISSTSSAVHGSEARNTVPLCGPAIFSQPTRTSANRSAQVIVGLCGIPWWTTDIGGFHGGVTEDPGLPGAACALVPVCTFCPVMRIHETGDQEKRSSTRLAKCVREPGADNEVWSFGEKLQKTRHSAGCLCHRLLSLAKMR